MSSSEKLSRQILKIDEVTIDASLSTGTSLNPKINPEKYEHNEQIPPQGTLLQQILDTSRQLLSLCALGFSLVR